MMEELARSSFPVPETSGQRPTIAIAATAHNSMVHNDWVLEPDRSGKENLTMYAPVAPLQFSERTPEVLSVRTRLVAVLAISGASWLLVVCSIWLVWNFLWP